MNGWLVGGEREAGYVLAGYSTPRSDVAVDLWLSD